MNSERSIGSALAPQAAPRAPTELPPNRLAEAMAVILHDLVGALDVRDRSVVLERLANRLDDRGRTAGGTEAAALLGAVGGALMRLER
jgi:hypothetical protein